MWNGNEGLGNRVLLDKCGSDLKQEKMTIVQKHMCVYSFYLTTVNTIAFMGSFLKIEKAMTWKTA